MPAVKIANPASALMLVNGGQKMRKRRTTTTRRHKVTNPRRRVSIKVNPRRRAVHSRRRRNPGSFAGTGLIKDAAFASLGGAASVAIKSLVNISFGGAIGDAAILAGIGYAVGMGVEKITGNKDAGRMAAIGGATIAVTGLLNSFGFNLTNILAPKPQLVIQKQGVGDIAAFPRGSYDSYYGSSPNLSGVGDIAAMRR